jgi:hypothetical protein
MLGLFTPQSVPLMNVKTHITQTFDLVALLIYPQTSGAGKTRKRVVARGS